MLILFMAYSSSNKNFLCLYLRKINKLYNILIYRNDYTL
ncbi:hypothetical protein X975_16423, partial [Stegodyphus mimosarum]